MVSLDRAGTATRRTGVTTAQDGGEARETDTAWEGDNAWEDGEAQQDRYAWQNHAWKSRAPQNHAR